MFKEKRHSHSKNNLIVIHIAGDFNCPPYLFYFI